MEARLSRPSLTFGSQSIRVVCLYDNALSFALDKLFPYSPLENPLRSSLVRSTLFAAFSVCTTLLSSQTTKGLLFGTARDATGAVLPGATVTVTDTLTGLQRVEKTSASGEYSASVPPGTYRVSFADPGFSEQIVERVPLSVNDKVHIDGQLTPGTSETVTVTEGVSPTNTASSELSRVISEHEVAALPLNNRNLGSLFQLSTGVVQSRPNTSGSFSYGGTSQYGYNLSIDGTDASAIEAPTTNDAAGTGRLNTISLDAIREFQIETASFSAVNGRATGAILNLVSKSGSDSFHGTAFEYFRNNYLDALNKFATSATPLRQNQFGGSLGGPILKNKLFFFGSYEGSRALIGQIVTSNVPTLGFRQAAPAVYAAYFAALPLPQTIVSSTTGVYRRQDNFIANENLYDGRVDKITDRSDLFARYTLTHSNDQSPSLFPSNPLIYPITQNLATVGYTYSFSPRLLNDVRVGLDRYNNFRNNPTYGTSNLGSIVISGILPTGNTEGVLHFVDDTYTLSDTLTYKRGGHTLRTGSEERKLDSYRQQRSNPIFTYTTAAKFYADTPDSVRLTYGHTGNTLGQWQTGLFIQDDWRLQQRLSLNLGLRWDYFSPLFEKKGQFFNTGADPYGAFNPAGAPLYNKDWKNFQPRVGFSWDVYGTQQTVLRGGAGVYSIALPAFFIWNGATINPSIPASATYTPSAALNISYPLTGALAAANANPSLAASSGLAPATVSRSTIEQNEPTPYTYNFNLTAEQAFAKSYLFQAGYVGSRGVKQPGAQALNLINPATGLRPNTAVGEIDLTTGIDRRNYNSLQVALRRRFLNSFSFNANYTWAKLIIYGNEDAFGPGAVQDWSNPAGSRGPGALDVRHTVAIDTTWMVPIGALNRYGLAKHILGGWTLTNIDLMRSGYPVNFLTGQDVRGNGFASTQRPNYNGATIAPASRSITNWFNKSAFSNPAKGTFGNIGYDAGRGPARLEVDLGIQRQFNITERTYLAFRGEAFNLPNRVNYFLPDGNINSATFGQITSADNPRQLQLSLRLGF